MGQLNGLKGLAITIRTGKAVVGVKRAIDVVKESELFRLLLANPAHGPGTGHDIKSVT